MNLNEFISEVKDDHELMLMLLKKFSSKGNLDMVKMLLRNIYYNFIVTDCILDKAAYHGHDHIIAYIIDNDFPVNKRAASCLNTAIIHSRISTVKLLLSYGFGVDADKKELWESANCYGDDHVIQLLKDLKFDINS